MRFIATLLAASCIAGIARAEPGGVSGVSGATMTRGETKIEFRTTAFEGEALDDSWNYRAQAGHTFTDWWRGALILRASQPASGDAEASAFGVENAFAFTGTAEWPVQFGGLIEYKFGLNDRDDEVELKLLAERRVGDLGLRFNLIAEREVGSGAEWVYGYAARGMWSANERFAFGLEAFGEPEFDAHYAGPRATLRMGDATIALGYLVGFDDAQSDGQIRLGVEFSAH